MTRRRGIMLGFMAALLAGGMGLIGCAGWLQEQLIFFPDHIDADADLSWTGATEEVYLDTEDGARIHGLFFESAGDSSGVVLYFHGNAGSVASWYEVAARLVRYEVDVLLIDYRTYGKSEGELSEHGLYRDGDAAYQHLISRGYAPESIVVYGRSLGGAVATHVASEHDVAAMALETPFTDLYELATDLYPFPMPQSLFEYSFDNKNRAPQIDVPTWVVHGTEDRIVPVDHGRRVFQALSNGWKMTIIEGGGHNDLMGFEEHGRDLALFFDHVLD